MKKNIAYYLEDPSRLSEISLHELNKWVEEMPYSQPLRLLVDIKSEQFVSNSSQDVTSYGAYFAEDYEPLSKKAIKKLAKTTVDEKEDTPIDNVEMEEEESISSDAEELVNTDADSITKENTADLELKSEESVAEEIKSNEDIGQETLVPIEPSGVAETVIEENDFAELVHNLADDFAEDIIEDDLLEINPNVVLVNEVSHSAADDVLEDELEFEVSEISLEVVEEISSFGELDVEIDSDIVTEDKNLNAGLVDYKKYVRSIEADASDEQSNQFDEFVNEELNFEVIEEKREVEAVPEIKKKKKSKAKSSAKKEDSKKSKSKKKSQIAEDKSQKAKKKKSDKKNKLENKKTQTKKSKKKPIKKVSGKISMSEKSPKSKPVKGKTKKVKKEVKYVVVNEASKNDFKMKDFDGVSNFTNWLLEQKSINGNLPQKVKKQKEVLAEKKKKKGKKKKTKVLKVAQDSVKKSQMIISEPLANIMAAQGHIKKAKKMYKQLGLIFPEKSGYFAAKIEKLKKK